jgi:hypothetical protein
VGGIPIAGQRTIRSGVDALGIPIDGWEGSTANNHYAHRRWRDTEPEKVEAQMNRALGEIPTGEYRIIERKGSHP